MNTPPQDTLAALYNKAFAVFGNRALWNIKKINAPTVAEILAITQALRVEGDMRARALAEQIEREALATH